MGMLCYDRAYVTFILLHSSSDKHWKSFLKTNSTHLTPFCEQWNIKFNSLDGASELEIVCSAMESNLNPSADLITLGERTVSVVGPGFWNSLPASAQSDSHSNHFVHDLRLLFPNCLSIIDCNSVLVNWSSGLNLITAWFWCSMVQILVH